MQIKDKLTLSFTGFVALVLVGLNFWIYLLTKNANENRFLSLLKDRALIFATIQLEADEENAVTIKKFQEQFQVRLPHEHIEIYDQNDSLVYAEKAEKHFHGSTLLNIIRKNKEYSFLTDDEQITGMWYRDNQGDFVIIAAATDVNGALALNKLLDTLVLGFIISIVVLYFTTRYFAGLVLKPIASIAEQANRISETNLHLRLDEGNGKDELAELSKVINRMLTRLENAFDLQKSFVANASHELRTPLTSIIGNIEVTLAKARTVDEHKEILESILVEAEKLHSLTNGLLNLAQSNLNISELAKEEIRMDELMLELIDEIRVKRPKSKIELHFPDLPEDPELLSIYGDKNLLEIALLNIIDNACKFSDSKPVSLTFQLIDKSLYIEVKDSGIGIGQEELPHITETFYRASNARSFSGYGIGLALTDRIIRLHKGNMSINSELGIGTIVNVFFSQSS